MELPFANSVEIATAGFLKSKASAAAPTVPEYWISTPALYPLLIPENTTSISSYKNMYETLKNMGIEVEIGAAKLEIAPRYTPCEVYCIRR